MTPDERFDAKVIPEPNSGCHLWLGSLINDGYGQFTVCGKKVLAHRFAFARANGSIPDGVIIRHTCDVRCCVNEQHLIPGTHADNANDKVIRGRSVRGSSASWSKLTEADVIAIRSADGSLTEIAQRFNTSVPNVSDIRRGRRWSWLQQEEAA